MDETLDYLRPFIPRLLPYISNPLPTIRQLINDGKQILVEGQLGTLRDLDWGNLSVYDFVESGGRFRIRRGGDSSYGDLQGTGDRQGLQLLCR